MITEKSIADRPAIELSQPRPKKAQVKYERVSLPSSKTKITNSPSEKTEMHHAVPDVIIMKPVTEHDTGATGENNANGNFQAPKWKKILDVVESKSCWLALGANFLGAILMKLGFSEATQKRIESIVSTILKLSFVPYGMSGIADGVVRKNIFTILGFTGELIFPWLGSLKNIYLIRGLPTGTDQLWTATDHHVSYKNGIFPDFKTGFIEVTRALWKLTKELVDPIKCLFTLETKGHHAFLSSVGSAMATIGYALTGRDKEFRLLRDLSAPLFDWGMLLEEKWEKKISGICFMFESLFDHLSGRAKSYSNKLALNMVSQGSGRLGLMLYKNSSPVATVTA